MKPYYQDDFVTLFHADCLERPELWTDADVLVTDPPYGVGFRSAWRSEKDQFDSILGDGNTEARDKALTLWGGSQPLYSAPGAQHDQRMYANASSGRKATTLDLGTCLCLGATGTKKSTC